MVKLILSCVLSISAVPALQSSGLFSATSALQYPGHLYTEWPKPIFLFFAGEPITLSVMIGNRGPDADIIQFTTRQPQQMFRVSAFRNNQPIELRVAFDHGEWQDSTGQVLPFRIEEPTTLNRKEHVQWLVHVGQLQQPGVYRLVFEPHAVSSAGRPISVFGDVEFELRAASALAQPELARREAVRQYLAHGPYGAPEVDAALDRLLRLHPSSYEGYMLRGHIARARGNDTDAVNNYTRAASILMNDEDALLVKFRDARERRQMLDNVNALIKRQ